MKIATIVGARPQFIKAAPVSRAIRERGHQEILVHTGQHYDYAMSRVFFEEMGIPDPDVNLEVGSGPHGWQTGQMLMRLEEVLRAEAPDWVLVYGDTNSTLAAALAACKLRIPLAHVEAGLRSFNRAMPEEHNRVLTDHCSDLLLCPTPTAVANLAREGITAGVHLVGDVMAEGHRSAAERAHDRSDILTRLDVAERGYYLLTVHRAENTDQPDRLRGILSAVNELRGPVVFPVHPRTRRAMDQLGYPCTSNVRLIEPVGYLDMVRLEQSALAILTDSGGIQKEAFWLGVPCLTLRDETEWVETLVEGRNTLVGAESERILQAADATGARTRTVPEQASCGRPSVRCVELLTAASRPTGA